MKRLLGCAALMLVLPFCVSRNSAITSPDPFPTQAFAGHTFPGGRSCQCGDDGCICDPGEAANVRATSSQSNTGISNRELNRQPISLDSEPGLAALVFSLLIIVLLLRMR